MARVSLGEKALILRSNFSREPLQANDKTIRAHGSDLQPQ